MLVFRSSHTIEGMHEPSTGEPVWRSFDGTVVDDIVGRVSDLTQSEPLILHVGTDSQMRGQTTRFVTVITLVRPGRGGLVFYRSERIGRDFDLAHKLFREAELSINTALELAPRVDQEIWVHVDANEDRRHRSSAYVKALAGMVLGYGFQVRLKPDSWCASSVADHLAKGRSRAA